MLGFHRVIPSQAAPSSDDHRAGCSFSDVQQLTKAVKHCVSDGGHCEECKRVAQYVADFWGQPHLVRLSWYGSSTVNPRVLDQLLDVLATFVEQIQSSKLPQDDVHHELVAIVNAFLVQHQRLAL